MIRTEFLSRPVQLEKYRDNVLWLFIEETTQKPCTSNKNGSHILHGKKSNFCQRTRQTLFPLSLRDHVCLLYLRYDSRISFPFSFLLLSFYLLSVFLSIYSIFSLFSFFFLFSIFFFFLFFCKIAGHNWFIDVARFSCMFYRHLITIKNIFFRIP